MRKHKTSVFEASLVWAHKNAMRLRVKNLAGLPLRHIWYLPETACASPSLIFASAKITRNHGALQRFSDFYSRKIGYAHIFFKLNLALKKSKSYDLDFFKNECILDTMRNRYKKRYTIWHLIFLIGSSLLRYSYIIALLILVIISSLLFISSKSNILESFLIFTSYLYNEYTSITNIKFLSKSVMLLFEVLDKLI